MIGQYLPLWTNTEISHMSATSHYTLRATVVKKVLLDSLPERPCAISSVYETSKRLMIY